jgi:hypothetical protein
LLGCWSARRRGSRSAALRSPGRAIHRMRRIA